MNTRDKIHNLELIYEVFCAEMNKLRTTIGDFLQESSKIYKIIYNQLEESHMNEEVSTFALIAYDEYLTKISNTTDMTRKFNLHLYFQEKQQKFDLENVCSQVNALSFNNARMENHNQAPEVEVEPEPEPEPEPLFLYKRASIDHFKVNSEIDACVVYVDRNPLSLSFSICEMQNPLISGLINLLTTLNGNCKKVEGIPDPKEVFGLIIDNQLFRTVRENTKDVKEKYLACLLEFGEVTEIHNQSEMFHLPQRYRDIPAQAVKCELVSVNGNSDCELRAALLRHECNKAKFTVVRKDDSILYMNLLEEELNTTPSPEKKVVEEEVKPTAPPALNIETNPFIRGNVYPDADAVLERNGLTAAQLDELYEEPVIQTSNAMKAVMGYDPKDDRRICKFYNPVTKSCFKGSNCRMEHTAIIKEGWTKDEEAVYIDVCVPMAYPKDGSIIRVIPTHIVDVCTFYAQMEFSERNDNPLFWSSRDIPESSRLKSPPYQCDLVLAQFNDGNWYRAKVMDCFENNTFRVFYVDYGNEDIVPLTSLAAWNKSLSTYSFQAFLCRIAGIANATRNNKVDEQNALKIIGGLILDQFVSVRVLNSTDEMLIEFIDKNCAKLPEILVWQRFAHVVDKIL